MEFERCPLCRSVDVESINCDGGNSDHDTACCNDCGCQASIEAWNSRTDIGDGWVSVEDELPHKDASCKYLVISNGEPCVSDWYPTMLSTSWGFRKLHIDGHREELDVTHWMPIPNIPTK